MRALLSTYGSRGDVEPMGGLAVALQARGAEVQVSAPPDEEFAAVLDRAGVQLTPAFSSVREWATKAMSNPSAVDLPTRAAQIVAAQYKALAPAAAGCDVILAAGLFPSTAAARLIAEQLGIPFVYATFASIWLPSTHHRPHSYPNSPLPADETDNRRLWDLGIENMNATFGAGVNAQRARLGLGPVDNVRDWVFTGQPWLAADPMLGPWEPTDLAMVLQTGAWLLPDRRPLPRKLQAFIEAGPAPVYVGFGSMPMQAARDAAQAAVSAIRDQGRRAILLKGWADLALSDDADDCFVVGDVNQQALFPRMAAVVHHGGAGTTTAAARAGVPQVVVPQIGDQPYWARRVAELGIGAALEDGAPTLEALSAALAKALRPDATHRAAEAAGRVRTDGAATAAGLLLEVAGRRG